MVNLNDSNKKVDIAYPCEWKYKVIGEDKDKIKKAVKYVIKERPHRLDFSKTSNKGSYHSYELCILVHNKDERIELFHQLKEHNDIKIVL